MSEFKFVVFTLLFSDAVQHSDPQHEWITTNLCFVTSQKSKDLIFILQQKPDMMHRFYLLLNVGVKEPQQIVIVTRQQGGLPKIRVWLLWGARDFSVCHNIHSKFGARLPSYSVGTRHCIPNGVKQLEHEAEHLPPRGMLKNASPFVIVEWYLLKHQENFACSHAN